MTKTLKLIFSFILLLHVSELASPATIHGTIYEWHTLEPLKNVIINVNSTPPQRFIAKDGSYEVGLGQGVYDIEARYYVNNELIYYSKENVSIEADGDFILDIIMFPNLDLDEKLFNDFNENLSIEAGLLEQEVRDNGDGIVFLAIFSLIIVLLIPVYLLKYRGKKATMKESAGAIPEDLGNIVDILRRNGGRMTQTDLRKELHYSEAKVSLMLADLENRGLVEKFKRGRGNVIILKRI